MLDHLAKRLLPWQIDAVALAFFAALGLVVYFAIIGPSQKLYCDRDVRATQLAEQLIHQRELEITLRKMRDAAASARKFLVTQNLSLEPQNHLNDRLAAIYSLATECGLMPEQVEPQREVAEPLFTTIALRLGGRGSYQNCIRFLERSRKEMPHNTVAAVEFSGSSLSAEPTVSFSFLLIWHAAPGSMARN